MRCLYQVCPAKAAIHTGCPQNNDCNQEYIGQTKRQFGTRLKEHQKAVSLSKRDNSALSEHTCQTNHSIAWGNSKIITTNRRYHQRRCLEACTPTKIAAPQNWVEGIFVWQILSRTDRANEVDKTFIIWLLVHFLLCL